MREILKCWCGNANLAPFSPGYLLCKACETLVAIRNLKPESARVKHDDKDFYGREYWFSHQKEELGFSDITERARADLSERCLHWLRALIEYKLPPGKTLELGSAHGGFVAMLRWTGFEAIGLELSPWVVEYARNTFAVPVLLGPLEDQPLDPETFDVISLFDVLEHMANPADMMKTCLTKLKTDGFLMIQTPRLPEEIPFEQMQSENHAFLQQLKGDEHLYLFSEKSIRSFFQSLGAEFIVFEPPAFPQYDMFLFVSRNPLEKKSHEEIEKYLRATPSGMLIQACLDLNLRLDQLSEKFRESEEDRAARLRLIQELSARLQEPLRRIIWRRFQEWRGRRKQSS